MIKSALIQNSRYGVKDRCLGFDGVNNHYIDIYWIRNEIAYNKEWTIEGWIKFDSFPTGNQVNYVSIRNPHYITIGYMGSDMPSWPEEDRGKIFFLMYKSPGVGTYPNYLFGITPSLDTWYHIVITSDGEGFFKMYVNGVLTDSDDLIEPEGAVISDECVLGMQIYGAIYQRRLDGLMDEFRLWNHARTEAQIKRYMNTRLYGTETGLVAYYRMDEGTGDTVHDMSQNSNNGTRVGATWIKP